MTEEYITMPKDHFGMISIKFTKKARGLINISGFHLDPGYHGRIIFSVFNAGPSDVVLKFRERIFMIFFYQLGHLAKPYDEYGTMNNLAHLPTELVTSLKGSSASLTDVDRRVSRLETVEKIFIGLLVALVAGVILSLFS